MTIDLPTGTVTFLFTDIVGSTPFWEREPDAMKLALEQHHAILRQAIESQTGQVFKTVGDAFLAAFSLPSKAADAAIAAQRELAAQTWPTSDAIRVRMGIHIGPAVTEGGDYATTHTLNRVTRIMSAAHGGQVLLSVEAADMIRSMLPAEVTLRDMGLHRLKGLSQLEHLYQIVTADLASDFPPLASAVSSPNNLPVQLTSFVGREKEIDELKDLVANSRLVTLTGSGGTGKTRLSLEVANIVMEEFPDGVWLVELAPLTDPEQVPKAVAAVWSLQEQPGQPITQTLKDYLHLKTLLLILDNCEHLIEACARLTATLLSSCPNLKVLPSSRESLGVPGETTYHLPSLSLPEADQSLSEASWSSYEAVRLFVERAQAARPDFKPGGQNLAAIANICRRLDGIPLALELAAARVKMLSVEQIAERLDDRFRLLTGGSRTALPRQQTLRALIDWSYDLLDDQEKAALRQLSVFSGGFTFDAAEAVVGPEALDLLDQLVTRSMVVVDEGSEEARYHLLETIRQYSSEKLFEAQEAAQARDRHLAYYLTWVENSESKIYGPEIIPYLDQLDNEQENLRAAIGWALANQPMSALRMAAGLYIFWTRLVSPAEELGWLKNALKSVQEAIENGAEPPKDFPYIKAKALTGQAYVNFLLGDNSTARSYAETSISLARQLGAWRTLAMALTVAALIAGMQGDAQMTHAWAEENLKLCREKGYYFELGMLGGAFMFLSENTNQPYQPLLQAEDLRAVRLSGNPWVIALAVFHEAQWAKMNHNWAQAYAGHEEAAVLFRQMRDQLFFNASRSEMGHILRYQGHLKEAAAIYRETIRRWQELGQRSAVAHELECFGFVATAGKQGQRAARLFGAAEILREEIGASMMPAERREYDQVVADLRLQLDEDAFVKTWSEGRDLSMEEAVNFAVQIDEPAREQEPQRA